MGPKATSNSRGDDVSSSSATIAVAPDEPPLEEEPESPVVRLLLRHTGMEDGATVPHDFQMSELTMKGFRAAFSSHFGIPEGHVRDMRKWASSHGHFMILSRDANAVGTAAETIVQILDVGLSPGKTDIRIRTAEMEEGDFKDVSLGDELSLATLRDVFEATFGLKCTHFSNVAPSGHKSKFESDDQVLSRVRSGNLIEGV